MTLVTGGGGGEGGGGFSGGLRLLPCRSRHLGTRRSARGCPEKGLVLGPQASSGTYKNLCRLTQACAAMCQI